MIALRKICLIVGGLWLTYAAIDSIYLIVAHGDVKEAIAVAAVYGMLPTFIFWKLTGVWPTVANWFKE